MKPKSKMCVCVMWCRKWRRCMAFWWVKIKIKVERKRSNEYESWQKREALRECFWRTIIRLMARNATFLFLNFVTLFHAISLTLCFHFHLFFYLTITYHNNIFHFDQNFTHSTVICHLTSFFFFFFNNILKLPISHLTFITFLLLFYLMWEKQNW